MDPNNNSEKAKQLLSEYRRLLEEAENSPGLDEENLPKQLEDVRNEYKKLTGKNIDSLV